MRCPGGRRGPADTRAGCRARRRQATNGLLCHLGLGTLYAKIGRGEQGSPELAAAIALYRTMGMTCWLPQAEAALAQAECQ
jgi:hypothetical protein